MLRINYGSLFWLTDAIDDFECFHTFVFKQSISIGANLILAGNEGFHFC